MTRHLRQLVCSYVWVLPISTCKYLIGTTSLSKFSTGFWFFVSNFRFASMEGNHSRTLLTLLRVFPEEVDTVRVGENRRKAVRDELARHTTNVINYLVRCRLARQSIHRLWCSRRMSVRRRGSWMWMSSSEFFFV